MFTSLRNKGRSAAHVVTVTENEELAVRLKSALHSVEEREVACLAGSFAQCADNPVINNCALVIAELRSPYGDDLAAIERFTRRSVPAAPAVVVIGENFDASITRQFLKLSVADWLPSDFSESDLIAAIGPVLEPERSASSSSGTVSIGFMSAIGGAGATTLSIAAMEALYKARNLQPSSCCIVDLNLQSGTVADYLDLTPNLDLDEIADAPERLDEQLLEVMISQHPSGLSALTARPSLTASDRINEQLLFKILDLAAQKFPILIIDMPPVWQQRCNNIILGTDKFYFVTDMSVAGLRRARRLVELVSEKSGKSCKRSVIVNKAAWLGVAGVRKQHANEILGDYLAGFIPDSGKLLGIAQNEGVLLSETQPRNALNKGISGILAAA